MNRHAAALVQHVSDAVARLEGRRQRGAQLCTGATRERERGDRHFDAVLDEPLEARKRLGRHERAVDAQLLGAARRRPARQVRVDALALGDQRREQLDAAPALPRSSCAAMCSGLCGAMATSQSGQYWIASLTYMSRRKW